MMNYENKKPQINYAPRGFPKFVWPDALKKVREDALPAIVANGQNIFSWTPAQVDDFLATVINSYLLEVEAKSDDWVPF